jgi:ubiquinol-cytochrome c reductase cytochrome b subunit
VLLLAGGNDIVALTFRVSLNALTWALRVAVIVLPVLAFLVTKRVCVALRDAEHERLAKGMETGDVRQTIEGGYTESHRPVEAEERHILQRGSLPVAPPQEPDASAGKVARLRAALHTWYVASAHPQQPSGDAEEGFLAEPAARPSVQRGRSAEDSRES